MTGEMAAKILKGEATADSMPYKTVTDFADYVNSDALKEMGLTLPSSIADTAIEAK